MWWLTAAALAQAAPAPPAPPAPAPPAPAPPPGPTDPGTPVPVAPPAPAAAPAPAPSLPDAPPWFNGGCDVAVSIPADGKLAEPVATGSCDWTGKPKATVPKEGTPPAKPCHLYFKASSGFIMGDVIADKACPSAWTAAAKGFVLGHTWSDGEYHLAVTFSPP